MARKSNKTAHVLNLIAGHDAQKETGEEANTVDTGNGSKAAASEAAAPKQTSTTAAQGISVIDTTEEDPVADLIQHNLSSQFEQPADSSEAENIQDPLSVSEPETAPVVSEDAKEKETFASPETDKTSDASVSGETSTAAATVSPEVTTISETIDAPDLESNEVAKSTPISQSAKEPETPSISDTANTPEPSSGLDTGSIQESTPRLDTANATETSTTSDSAAPTVEPEPEPASTPEPEPDFVRLNIMEGIVKDKIIYFMRQFDVCTCDRCVNDTIALAMNGLLPKYIVTTPAAVDPLMSYYTNRLISDVTVEATKACMIVKDNPRH
ncbi:MAG: hypothetical protein HFH12_07080 [Dorea sp.]|nr:hypothetical protein [Dorea sp.]